jgi:regulatory protein
VSGDRLTCYERALRLLAGRAHFRAELARKLGARGYSRAEVDATLDRCAAEGYLDDEAAARRFVGERQRRGLGRARVAVELRRRGASADATAAGLAEVGDEGELARAPDAAAKWRRREGRGEAPADEEAKRVAAAALGRHLDRKGFSRRAILAVLESAGETDPELPGGDPAD